MQRNVQLSENRPRAKARLGGRLLAVAPVVSVMVAASLGCGSGDLVLLGYREPQLRFDEPARRVAAINSDQAKDDNPSFTSDLLQIFFTSERDGNSGDVWCAERWSRVDPFDPPKRVAMVNSQAQETSAAVSLDGLTLWVGSKRDRSGAQAEYADVWRATRAPEARERSCDEGWGPLEYELELNSEFDDIPRPLGWGERVMPMASRQDPNGPYHTYFFERGADGAFVTVGQGQVTPFSIEDEEVVDAFLSDDGRFLFFNRVTDGRGDLFMSWRRSLDEPFVVEIPLDDVNTEADERDPWLNPDGTRFFFSRDSGGERGLDIYGAHVDLTLYR